MRTTSISAYFFFDIESSSHARPYDDNTEIAKNTKTAKRAGPYKTKSGCKEYSNPYNPGI
jgi:hypothetical protein